MLSNKELHEQKTTLTSKTDELDPVSYVLEPTIHFNYRGQDILQNYQQSKWENHNPKNLQENKIHVSTLCYEPEFCNPFVFSQHSCYWVLTQIKYSIKSTPFASLHYHQYIYIDLPRYFLAHYILYSSTVMVVLPIHINFDISLPQIATPFDQCGLLRYREVIVTTSRYSKNKTI